MKKQKLKFKPEISRVLLQPEQAVLTCNCYHTKFGGYYGPSYQGGLGTITDPDYWICGSNREYTMKWKSPGCWQTGYGKQGTIPWFGNPTQAS